MMKNHNAWQKKQIVLVSVLALLTVGLFFLSAEMDKSVLAQGPAGEWFGPVVLYEGEGAWTQYNDLVASADGTVHAFWQSDPTKISENVEGEPGGDNLWYTRIRDNSIEEPVNILVPLDNGSLQESIQAVLDGQGNLHVFSSSSCLQHSIVNLESALLPQVWMDNTDCIGETDFRFGVTEDQEGTLHLAYNTTNGRLVYIRLLPGETQWSLPETIFEGKNNGYTSDSRIAVDSTGKIHVVWSEYEAPEYYPPTGIYYAQSEDGGLTWTRPEQLAESGHVEAEIITTENNQVHVIWNGAAIVSDRFHRYSKDGGLSWSETTALDIRGGILGPPDIAVDSANTVHAVYSGDFGVHYTYWSEGQGWSRPQQLGPKNQTGDPSVVITGGNQLHVLFREAASRIFYMSLPLDAPVITSEPTITPLPQVPQKDSSAPDNVSPTPTPHQSRLVPQFDNPEVERNLNVSPGLPILIGITPAVLVIVLVIGVKQMVGTRNSKTN